jgi:CheY-like chemotaxis protein
MYGKLLHVEDDPGMTQFVGEVLAHAEFTVEAVASGLDALKRIQAEPEAYELMILDLVLPWMNGLEVLAALRQAPATRALPVLVTTGTVITPNQFAGDPHVAVLSKPFDADQLRVAVETVLVKERAGYSARSHPH